MIKGVAVSPPTNVFTRVKSSRTVSPPLYSPSSLSSVISIYPSIQSIHPPVHSTISLTVHPSIHPSFHLHTQPAVIHSFIHANIYCYLLGTTLCFSTGNMVMNKVLALWTLYYSCTEIVCGHAK